MSSNNDRVEFFESLLNVFKGKIHKVPEDVNSQELIENINNARDEWIAAQKNFQFMDTDDGVDYYAYKIKAYEVKYQALLKEAKEKGLKITENGKRLFWTRKVSI